MSKTLKDYAVFARLYTLEQVDEIRKHGFVDVCGKRYASEEELFSAARKQLDAFVNDRTFEINITVDQAMSIIKGEKTIYDDEFKTVS